MHCLLWVVLKIRDYSEGTNGILIFQHADIIFQLLNKTTRIDIYFKKDIEIAMHLASLVESTFVIFL